MCSADINKGSIRGGLIPSLISLVVSVDVKHHVYLLRRAKKLERALEHKTECKHVSAVDPEVKSVTREAIAVSVSRSPVFSMKSILPVNKIYTSHSYLLKIALGLVLLC